MADPSDAPQVPAPSRAAEADRVRYPVQAAYTPPGPYATTTSTVADATAWLAYQLRGDPVAGAAFTGPHPELVSNRNWPGSAVK